MCTESRTEREREITEPACLLMENLPPEMLSTIFEHLSPEVNLSILPLVCRRWAEIQTNRRFFTDITFSDTEPSTEVCVFITSRARFLRSVTLIHRADADAILDVINDSTQLENITVVDHEALCSENVSGSADHREKIFPDVNSRITPVMSIEHIPASGNCCSEQVVRTLCERNNPTLQTLIVNAGELTDVTLERISECCSLTTLHLRHLRGITVEGIVKLRSLRNLRSLLFSHCYVSEYGLRKLFEDRNFPSLEEVKIVGCDFDIGMIDMFSDCVFPASVRFQGTVVAPRVVDGYRVACDFAAYRRRRGYVIYIMSSPPLVY